MTRRRTFWIVALVCFISILSFQLSAHSQSTWVLSRDLTNLRLVWDDFATQMFFANGLPDPITPGALLASASAPETSRTPQWTGGIAIDKLNRHAWITDGRPTPPPGQALRVAARRVPTGLCSPGTNLGPFLTNNWPTGWTGLEGITLDTRNTSPVGGYTLVFWAANGLEYCQLLGNTTGIPPWTFNLATRSPIPGLPPDAEIVDLAFDYGDPAVLYSDSLWGIDAQGRAYNWTLPAPFNPVTPNTSLGYVQAPTGATYWGISVDSTQPTSTRPPAPPYAPGGPVTFSGRILGLKRVGGAPFVQEICPNTANTWAVGPSGVLLGMAYSAEIVQYSQPCSAPPCSGDIGQATATIDLRYPTPGAFPGQPIAGTTIRVQACSVQSIAGTTPYLILDQPPATLSKPPCTIQVDPNSPTAVVVPGIIDSATTCYADISALWVPYNSAPAGRTVYAQWMFMCNKQLLNTNGPLKMSNAARIGWSNR